MVEKNWIIKSQAEEKDLLHLKEVLNVDKAIANLLVQRGIKDYDSAKKFFRPKLEDLYDPFLMKDMDLAVARLEPALENNEKILVYGDYDVDGTTSVAMMYTFLRNFTSNIDFYIPNRYIEGYGISFKAIDYAFENAFTLIIALDCGIKAIDKVIYAKERNIEFIVCDHHTAGDEIPNAAAVLDPKRHDCDYPCKELSGCGVGFKFMQAITIRKNLPFDTLIPYLDLVAVSIASDIVPIIDENRILAHYGLKQLNENPRMGLAAIIKVSGIEKKEITVDDVVFKIGPRINAAGRIESGKHSVELLIAETEQLALDISDKINDYNTTRRSIDGLITKQAMDMISSDASMIDRTTTVLFNREWHKGVIGIVASRLTESYYRPTVILTESNGFITGSARSVIGFDIYKAIDACSDLLENFGGHMYAAGLTLKESNLKAFLKRFEQVVTETISPEMLIPVVEIDTEIRLKDITPKFVRIIKQFEPFGPGNMAPVFLTENVSDNGTGMIVGSTREHLKLNLIQEDDPYHVYPAIGFNLAHYYDTACKGYGFDICYTLEENEFRGKKNLQLRLKDIKVD